MRFGPSGAVVGFSLALTCALANASQQVVSDLPPHYIIERLKEVRQGWEEVEIEYVQSEKRQAFEPRGLESRMAEGGRLVLTPPDCGELETFPVDQAGHRKGDEGGDRFVWTVEEFQMRNPNGHVEAISRSDLRKRDGQLWARPKEAKTGDQKPTLLQWLVMAILPKWEFTSPKIAESPKDCLPLVFADDIGALSERFELSVTENDEHLFLHARPKQLCDKRNFRETAICIDRESFLPVAKRTVLPAGDYIVWIVMCLRVNGEEVAVPLPHAQGSDREDEVAARR